MERSMIHKIQALVLASISFMILSGCNNKSKTDASPVLDTGESSSTTGGSGGGEDSQDGEDGENSGGGDGGVSDGGSGSAPSAPTSLSRSMPSTYLGSSATPFITVAGVVSGDTIKIFTDSSCSTEVGSVVAGAPLATVQSSTLVPGSYTFYANATNSYGTSSCSSAFTTYTYSALGNHSCPANYLLVPHNPAVGTHKYFCVMKYEAKAQDQSSNIIDSEGESIGFPNSYVPASHPDGKPWRNIMAFRADTECRSLDGANGVTDKYFLTSNKEWMTIARDLESVSSNWESGEVGVGALYRGHSDNDPPVALEAGLDNFPYTNTANSSDDIMGSGKEQRRTLTLSTGGVLWDFAGNAQEWVDWNEITSGFQSAPTSCSTPSEFFNVSCLALAASDFSPLDASLGYQDGVGYFLGGSGGAAARGGTWSDLGAAGIYTINLWGLINQNYSQTGFRCVYRP
jgi:hypothetical protein